MGTRKDRNRTRRQNVQDPGRRPPQRLPGNQEVDALAAPFRQKRFEQACSRAREFVCKWPDVGLGWNVLGASLHALGHCEEAVSAYRRALEIEPDNPEGHNNLGNVLRELDRQEEASRHHARAIELKPGLLEAHYNLGLALAALARHREAQSAFERVVRMRPDMADAHNHLGNQLKAQGRLAEAARAYERAVAASPNHAAVLSNLALVQAALGMPDEAEQSYRLALRARPGAPDILSNLGTFLMGQGRLTEAESCYRAAMETHADSADLHNNLGVVLQNQGRLKEAAEVFERATKLAPDTTSAWHNLGNVEMDLGRLDQAERCHRRVLELQPGSATAHRNLGVTLAVLGRRNEAEASYRRALDIRPGETEVYYRLAEVKTFTADDRDTDRIEALLEQNDLDADDRVYLHFAAGKAFADAGTNLERSFQHYLEGAAARRAQLDYEVNQDAARFDRIADVFPAGLVDRISAHGHDCDVPVFVVGMPRSGTTLVESILASHPDVHGAGERFDIGRLVDENTRARGRSFPDWIGDLTAAEWRGLGESYSRALAETAPDAARIVDKMPNNFQYLGLIAGILPNARVIHVQRSPMDTCVSCFTHLFENEQLFSYDLEELGRFYRAYHELMNHWIRVLPGDFLMSVRYEDIVHDPEPPVRAMLAHCGLEWDPTCLQPHTSSRAVATASLVQVRQPIYSGAIDRWKAYAGQLDPLLEALGDLAGEIPDADA